MITPEQARAELARRRGVGITPEMARAELERRKSVTPAHSATETGIKGFAQGITGNMADEIDAGLTAIHLNPFSSAKGDTVAERYGNKLAANRASDAKDAAAHPVANMVGNVGGAVAQTVALPAIGSLKGAAAAGAGIGAVSGFGSGEGLEDSLKQAAISAGVGAGAGAATQGVMNAAKSIARGVGETGKNIAKGARALGGEELDAASASMKANASAAYKAAHAQGAVLSKATTNGLVSTLTKSLSNGGKVNARLHGDTLAVMQDIKAAAGRNLSLEEADQFRQLLSDVVSKNTTKLEGTNVDGRKALELINALDDKIASLGKKNLVQGTPEAIKGLTDARSMWSTWRKFDAVSRMVQKADGDANALQRQFKSYFDNPANHKGFTTQEIAMGKAIGRSTKTESALKMLGKFGLDRNNVLAPTVAGGLVGTVAGGPAGVGLAAAGTAAKYGSKLAARGRAQNLLDAVAKRGAQATQSAAPSANTISRRPLGVTLSARPEATAAALTLAGGLPLANFASSLATNTGDNPAMPVIDQVPDRMTSLANDRAYALDRAESSVPPRPRKSVIKDDLGAFMDKLSSGIQGLSDDFRQKVSMAESSGGKNLYAKTSNAVGEYQFVPKTWLAVVRQQKPEWAKGLSTAQILKKRLDPQISGEMFEALTADNVERMAKAGVPVSDTTAYAAHVLGVGDAIKVLKANQRAPLAMLVSRDKIDSNKDLMKGKTVEGFMRSLQRKMQGSV